MIERLLIALALAVALFGLYRLVQTRHRARASAQWRRREWDGNGQPSLLYFWSQACSPCVAQGHYLEQLPPQMVNRVKLEKIDAEAHQEMAASFGVFTLPTILFIDRQGSVRHVNYGLTDTNKLISQLESVL